MQAKLRCFIRLSHEIVAADRYVDRIRVARRHAPAGLDDDRRHEFCRHGLRIAQPIAECAVVSVRYNE